MTNKEAIKIAQGLITDFKCDSEIMVDFCNVVINALNQTDVIDKIVAEINTPNRGTCDYFIVDRIEKIINEYRKVNKQAMQSFCGGCSMPCHHANDSRVKCYYSE